MPRTGCPHEWRPRATHHHGGEGGGGDRHRRRDRHDPLGARRPRRVLPRQPRRRDRRRPDHDRPAGLATRAAAGRIVLTAEAAMEAGDRGEAVILVRPETTPDDVLGMQASRGILTACRHGQPRPWSPAGGGSRPSSAPAGSRSTVTPCMSVARRCTPATRSRSTAAPARCTSASSTRPVPTRRPNWRRCWRGGRIAAVRVVRANADSEGDASRSRARRKGIGLSDRACSFAADRCRSCAGSSWPYTGRRGGQPAGASSRSRPPTSRPSSRRWTGCPSPCACSTRRCTSSCPTSSS